MLHCDRSREPISRIGKHSCIDVQTVWSIAVMLMHIIARSARVTGWQSEQNHLLQRLFKYVRRFATKAREPCSESRKEHNNLHFRALDSDRNQTRVQIWQLFLAVTEHISDAETFHTYANILKEKWNDEQVRMSTFGVCCIRHMIKQITERTEVIDTNEAVNKVLCNQKQIY